MPTVSSLLRAITGAAFALGLLLGGSAAHAAPVVRLAVSKTHLSLPVYVALEQGHFAAEGLEVRAIECLGGHRCLRQVLDGQADLATVGDLPLTLASFERSDFRILATFATASDHIKLLARVRSGVRQPGQLAGKRVGITLGTGGHYFLETYLLNVGVDPRSVSVVGVQPEEMRAALQAGRVDAIATWEPFAHQARTAMGTEATTLPSHGAYLQSFNLVTTPNLAGSREADLVKVLAALERATRFIQQQPRQAKELLKQRLELNAAATEPMWHGTGYRLGLDQTLLATMEGEARWAIQEGHVKASAPPNFLPLLAPAALRRLKPEAAGVVR